MKSKNTLTGSKDSALMKFEVKGLGIHLPVGAPLGSQTTNSADTRPETNGSTKMLCSSEFRVYGCCRPNARRGYVNQRR